MQSKRYQSSSKSALHESDLNSQKNSINMKSPIPTKPFVVEDQNLVNKAKTLEQFDQQLKKFYRQHKLQDKKQQNYLNVLLES